MVYQDYQPQCALSLPVHHSHLVKEPAVHKANEHAAAVIPLQQSNREISIFHQVLRVKAEMEVSAACCRNMCV